MWPEQERGESGDPIEVRLKQQAGGTSCKPRKLRPLYHARKFFRDQWQDPQKVTHKNVTELQRMMF